jgi:hypothetical protein
MNLLACISIHPSPAARSLALAGALFAAPAVYPQAGAPAQGDPAAELAATLTAACRHDQTAFATHLTAYNANVFRELPQSQRETLLARLVLQTAPGRALLSTSAEGRPVVRCESGGIVIEMRFGTVEIRDNLAFVPVEVPGPGEKARSVRFGLVREDGRWRLISVGLLLLDLPAMAQEWVEADLRAQEARAVAALRKIAEALRTYQTAFGRLPEALEQLGPAPPGGISPERAALLDEALAAAESGGYRFRYVIVPAAGTADESERAKSAGFALVAMPAEYGGTGRRSFYLDSGGVLRGADKQGQVATQADPRVDDPRP